MSDIFGQDIKVDEKGQAIVAANGELVLTQGVETGVQDVRLRLGTPLEQLFYDIEYGALLHEYYLDELTPARQAEFEAEVEQRIEEDPRVVLGTAGCKVTSSNERGFTAEAYFEFIGEDQPFNLVFDYSNSKRTMVISDVNPRSGQ